MHEIFTDEWARQWCRAIHESAEYRSAASGWEGAILVVMSADPDMGVASERRVFLDLRDGDCRGGRRAEEADAEAALFVLRAAPATWHRVLAGEVEPVWGLMSGKIELAKGSIAQLIPYTLAAKRMVEAAAAMPSTFPAGWNGDLPR